MEILCTFYLMFNWGYKYFSFCGCCNLQACALVLILAFLFPNMGTAQDSIPRINIDSIVVTASRLEFESSGTHMYENVPNIVITNSSVGDALSYATPIIFKQYGPGMLQTASARGTGAGHLGVNWNGINIQSMTHGQVDFGLIGLSEDISYIPGSNSAMDGSGSLGGLVLLSTKMRQKDGLHGFIESAWASFHNSQQNAQVRYEETKWASLTEINYKSGKNNFPYINTASIGQPTVKQENNEYQAVNFRQSNQWSINKNHLLNFHYWMTLSDRQIPPTMASANDMATQEDQSHRFLADWLFQVQPNVSLRTKLAQITEQLTFENQVLYSFTASTKQILDSRLSFTKGIHQIQFGVFQSMERAYSDGYGSHHQRLTSAISLSEKITLGEQLNFTAQTRLEAKNFNQVVPIFNLSGNYQLKDWSISGKFGRHYHAPTFNDLFWQNLGEPDLNDEIGYQGELSIANKIQKKGQVWSSHLTGFWLNVNDWILWAPDDAGTWRPSNNKKVVSKGIEASTGYSFDYQGFKINTNIGYTYVNTVNKKSIVGKSILNKQLIYVPKHKMNGLFGLSYKDKIAFNYSQIFVSKRPYKQDNSKFVPSYVTHNIQLTYTPTIKQFKVNIHVSITNLSNKNYQIIRLRPMPGRGFEMGLKLAF